MSHNVKNVLGPWRHFNNQTGPILLSICPPANINLQIWKQSEDLLGVVVFDQTIVHVSPVHVSPVHICSGDIIMKYVILGTYIQNMILHMCTWRIKKTLESTRIVHVYFLYLDMMNTAFGIWWERYANDIQHIMRTL